MSRGSPGSLAKAVEKTIRAWVVGLSVDSPRVAADPPPVVRALWTTLQPRVGPDARSAGSLAGPYGVEELAGNVWEWTRSQEKDYPYDARDGREDLNALAEARRVLRGGSYYLAGWRVRCASRFRLSPYFRSGGLGFRVVASPSRGA